MTVNDNHDEQEIEFSVTGNISDKLANPEETSKAKKKRKAREKLVIIWSSSEFMLKRGIYYRIDLYYL